MPRPRNVVHYTFEAGQADPQYGRRADADLWLLSAAELKNVRLINGGGFKRRPGLARIAATTGPCRLVSFTGRNGTKRRLALRDGALDVYLENRTLSATVTSGVSWLESALAELQTCAENDRIFVASREFFPQVIAWDGAAFTVADLEFYVRQDGSTGQPYWRFPETRGVTITPSADSGTGVTLQADVGSNVFNAGHVGVRFRFFGREVEITAVTDGDTATCDVIQKLYPTVRLTVGDATGFAVGEQCLSSVDDIEMEVVAIPDGTHLDVNLTGGFTSPTTASNNILGPNASTAISAVAGATLGGTVQWDEQLISAYRGYPGGCGYHKGRLVLLDFPQAPEIHALSVLREPTDYDTGEGDDADAIIDGPGDAVGRRARHVISSEQLVSLTDAGSYYVGEGPNTPITPTTVEFLRIGPEAATGCNPILASEGVIFSEDQGDRLMLLAPTGQLRRVWGATEILAIASALLESPVRLLLVDGSNMGPERYLLAVNNSGGITCVHYRRDSEIAGATPWETNGLFIDVALMGDEVWACVNRGGDYSLEYFDPDRLLDNSTLRSNPGGSYPTQIGWANRTLAIVWRTTVNVTTPNKDGTTSFVAEARRIDMGEFTASGAGTITELGKTERVYEGGDRFHVFVKLWSPIDPEVGPSEHVRIKRASIDVLNSGMFYANGQRLTAYRAADDVSAPPPLRTGWRSRRYSGRGRENQFELSQIEAAPLEVRAVSLEVS